ncbi:MAG: hybrid sensor histidine kinase/response regulator [Sandaracinaceae bacterium]|nr:hybrid sensor histidine kinase/response regulator [Sandaracinaceae bacterium]
MGTETETAPVVEAAPVVVAIDDTPANLRLLTAILVDAGYRVRALPGGRLGLHSVRAEPPDLVLLDVNMPEMNGFEVCRRMREDPALANVPVIFVSALDDTKSKLDAFLAGGMDYVTKPFRAEEVKARVRTHLELARARRELEASYARLRELERLRDSLTHMVVHDLRTPLNGLALTLELIDQDPELASGLKPDVESARRCVVTLTQLVTSMLDLARLESQRMPTEIVECPTADLVRDALGHLGVVARDPRLAILDVASANARCDVKLGSRVIANLVINALSFVPSRGGRVEVGAEAANGVVRIFVHDNGPGIPESAQQRIFEKFAQAEQGGRSARHSVGLGLTFCKMAVEAQGGRIGVESQPGRGSTFWFELPHVARSDASAS